MLERDAISSDGPLRRGGQRAQHQAEVLDLLGGGLLAPDAVPLKAGGGQRRGLEADQPRHLHGKLRRRVDDAREQVGIGLRHALVGCAVVPTGAVRGLRSSVGHAREADGVAVLGRRGLEAAIVCRAADDDAPDPLDDPFPLRRRQEIEVVRQVPRQPAPLRGVDAFQFMAPGGAALVRQLRVEIPFRQPIAAFDPTQNLHARDADRRLGSLHPASDGLEVEGLVGANDRPMQMPIALAMPLHVERQRFAERRRILPLPIRRLREFLHRLGLHAALPLLARRGLPSIGRRRCTEQVRLNPSDGTWRVDLRPRGRAVSIISPHLDARPRLELPSRGCVERPDDRVQGGSDFLLDLDQKRMGDPATLGDGSPIDAAAPGRRVFAMGYQAEQIGFHSRGVGIQERRQALAAKACNFGGEKLSIPFDRHRR